MNNLEQNLLDLPPLEAISAAWRNKGIIDHVRRTGYIAMEYESARAFKRLWTTEVAHRDCIISWEDLADQKGFHHKTIQLWKKVLHLFEHWPLAIQLVPTLTLKDIGALSVQQIDQVVLKTQMTFGNDVSASRESSTEDGADIVVFS